MRSFALYLALLAGLFSCQQSSVNTPSASRGQTDSIVVQVDSSLHLSLLFAGDLMQHEPQAHYAHRPDSSYSFSGYFDWISPEIERADVAFANLEVTISGKRPSGFPCFSAPDSYLEEVKKSGFDVLFTANNHSCDKGLIGVTRTLDMCDSLQLQHLGSYRNAAEREANYPFLLEQNGFRIAVLNATYGTNGLRIPEPTIVNLIDTVQMAADLAKAKSMHPDLIIVVPHWGVEYENLPRRFMVKQGQWFFDHGADYVVGSHPHVIQPIVVSADSLTGQQHLIAYSLGNLVSDQSKLPKYGGMMLRLELQKSGPHAKARLTNCGYMLTFVSRPQWSHNRNYRVYPVSVSDTLLNGVERSKLRDYLNLARPLLQEHNRGISEYFLK